MTDIITWKNVYCVVIVQSHCENSHGECRTAPSGRRPSLPLTNKIKVSEPGLPPGAVT